MPSRNQTISVKTAPGDTSANGWRTTVPNW